MAAFVILMASFAQLQTDVDGEPSRALPSRVNLSAIVPYHMSAGEGMTGEAGLSMIFDYHGQYIMQQDIRNVTKDRQSSDVAELDELIKAAHHSNNLPGKGYQERNFGYGAFSNDWTDDSPRGEMRIGDLYQALSEKHVVLLYMYLDMPPELGSPQPPDPNNPQVPTPPVTAEDLAALERVWRLVVGYDTGREGGSFIIHDPAPSGTGFLGGKSQWIKKDDLDALWTVYEVDGLSFSTQRVGMTAAPWILSDLEKPKTAPAGIPFDVSINVTYNTPSVMSGGPLSTNPNPPNVTLEIPDEYSFVDGEEIMVMDLVVPGSYQTISWKIRAPDRSYTGQDWSFRLNASGTVTINNYPNSHFDRIGQIMTFEVETVGFLNHPPVIVASLVDPEVVPDDGTIFPVVATKVEDEDGNIQTISIDITSIDSSSNPETRMTDDGLNGDEAAGDGIYSYRIRKTIPQGEYIMKITAKDTGGGRAYDNVTLVSEDAASFTSAPEIVDKGVYPFGVPNDGVTTSVVWAIVEDEEDDLERVEVDLTEIGGDSDVRMYDDGTSGDVFADDGNYSVEFTVSPLIELFTYQVEITAEDRAGHETSAKTWVDVILPPVPPMIMGHGLTPESVPNDGTTQVILDVEVEDDNDDIKVVTVDLTSISGSSAKNLNDDGIGSDIEAGDGVWTVSFTVGTSTSPGKKSLTITAKDNTDQYVTSIQTLDVTKANNPPSFGDFSIKNEKNESLTVFSPGETVQIRILAEDEDYEDLDYLTVTLDLTEFDLSTVTLEDDDGDQWFEGDFTIPENISAGNYNFTLTIADPAGRTYDKRIMISVRGSDMVEKDQAFESEYAMYGGIAGLVVLLVLVGGIIYRTSIAKPKRPPMQGMPPRGPPGRSPYGNPYNPNLMR